MASSLRPAADRDWPRILKLADVAAPYADNAPWLLNRRHVDETAHARRHYVAEDEAGALVGYGAIEGGSRPGRFRVFVVVPRERLADVGGVLFGTLRDDAAALGASWLWAREEARDAALLAFLREKGMVEVERFTAGAALDVVLLECSLEEGSPPP